MTIVPITLKAARAFIACHHRHHPTVTGQKLAIGVLDNAGELRGVAIVGRCSSRHLDADPLTAEVTRTCTDGYANANSALYGACWRIASAMGYRRLVTYTEAGESGASLTAAGWVKVRDLPARKNWANSSVALRGLRNVEAREGVARARWEKAS